MAVLRQQLAERADEDGSAPWQEDDAQIVLRMPADKAGQVRTEVVSGQKCLLIPLEGGESATINGVSRAL